MSWRIGICAGRKPQIDGALPALGHAQFQVFNEVHVLIRRVILLIKLAAVVTQKLGDLGCPILGIMQVSPRKIQRCRRQVCGHRRAGPGNVYHADDPDPMTGLKRRGDLPEYGLDDAVLLYLFPDQIEAVNGMILQRRQRVP